MGIALKVGDIYKCPEDHDGKIVWISEEEQCLGVRCPQKHFDKIVKVPDHSRASLSMYRYRTKTKKIFVRNFVFLMRF